MASPKARLFLDGLLMSWVASILSVCPYSLTLEASLRRRKGRVEAQASTGARPLLRHRLLLQPGGSRGRGSDPLGLKSVLVLAAVGYLNHGRGRDHSHRVQRSRGEQPFTKRLGVLYRGEFDAYEHLGGIVDTAKDLVRLGDFGASRRICVESRLPRVVIVGLMVQQHVGHREPPWIVPASDTDPNPPMAACEIRDRLLRHRLLLQPGGFEGFAWVIPGSEMSHLTFLAPHGVRQEELDRLSRTGAKHLDPNLGKDQVSGVDH